MDAFWDPADDSFGALEASLQVSTIAWSDVGRKRQNNEDNFLLFDLYRRMAHGEKAELTIEVERPGLLIGVADGMGGHQAGQVASQLCVENLPPRLLHQLDSRHGARSISRALVRAVEEINQLIFDQSSRVAELEGMGTTLVSAVLSDAEAVVALVGDSRAYLLSQGALKQLTTDQTVANYMAATHPGLQLDDRTGEMLVQAVGAQPDIEVVLSTSALEPSDLLLLCSDGLFKVLSANQIEATLQRPGTLKTKAEALVSAANRNGGPDNVTVVLAEVRQVGRADE